MIEPPDGRHCLRPVARACNSAPLVEVSSGRPIEPFRHMISPIQPDLAIDTSNHAPIDDITLRICSAADLFASGEGGSSVDINVMKSSGLVLRRTIWSPG